MRIFQVQLKKTESFTPRGQKFIGPLLFYLAYEFFTPRGEKFIGQIEQKWAYEFFTSRGEKFRFFQLDLKNSYKQYT